VKGLFLGGWGVPVAGAEPIGAPLHRCYAVVADEVVNKSESLRTLLSALYDGLSVVMQHGRIPREFVDLFERLDGVSGHAFRQDEIEWLGARERAGLALLIATLASVGQTEALEALVGYDDELTTALREVVSVVVYPGEVGEADAAARRYVGDGPEARQLLKSLGVVGSMDL
jgi:hypothetical protein